MEGRIGNRSARVKTAFEVECCAHPLGGPGVSLGLPGGSPRGRGSLVGWGAPWGDSLTYPYDLDKDVEPALATAAIAVAAITVQTVALETAVQQCFRGR